MTSIDVAKFAIAETRHPHKEILELLLRHVELNGELPLHSAVPRERILGADARSDELKKFSLARIERAIDSLVEAEIVEEGTDFWSGRRMLGIHKVLVTADAPNESLKEDVYRKAKGVGLWPKWRSSSGWQLVTGGDVTVCEGSMSMLNDYLDWQEHQIRR
jgi:hypothetical protein